MTLRGARNTQILRTKEFQQVPILEIYIFKLLLVAARRQQSDSCRDFVYLMQAGKVLNYLFNPHFTTYNIPCSMKVLTKI